MSRINEESCRPLVVEDEPADARLLIEALARCGVPRPSIEVAIDGEHALLLLGTKIRAAAPPSFIVMDLRLRRRPGVEVLEWIKSQPELASVPVMVLSGMDGSPEAIRARDLGADSFYPKPLRFSELVQTTDLMIQRWREIASKESCPSR